MKVSRSSSLIGGSSELLTSAICSWSKTSPTSDRLRRNRLLWSTTCWISSSIPSLFSPSGIARILWYKNLQKFQSSSSGFFCSIDLSFPPVTFDALAEISPTAPEFAEFLLTALRFPSELLLLSDFCTGVAGTTANSWSLVSWEWTSIIEACSCSSCPALSLSSPVLWKT